jgi:hypothetical protein
VAEACGLVIIKQFEYRNTTDEEWSNKYWLTGTPPQSPAGWKTLADQLIDMEHLLYTPATQVVRAYGYDDNAEHAASVWGHDYLAEGEAVAGTLADAGSARFAGDQAGFCWWQTSRRTSRGKWIYLRKYFHDGLTFVSDSDAVSGMTGSQYIGFAAKLFDGSWAGARVIRSQSQDELLQASGASSWVTTRTLKRRAKRPLVLPPGP